jgi:hypothetical protein
MQPVRALLLALVLLALTYARAEEALPPILVPRKPPVPVFVERLRERPRPPVLISEHTRAAINAASYEALATAKPFDAPGSPTGRVSPLPGFGSDATVMKPFVVRSIPLVIREARIEDPPLLRLIKTGTLYKSINAYREMEIFFNAATITERWGLQRDRDFTRVSLMFSLKW